MLVSIMRMPFVIHNRSLQQWRTLVLPPPPFLPPRKVLADCENSLQTLR